MISSLCTPTLNRSYQRHRNLEAHLPDKIKNVSVKFEFQINSK